MKRHALTAGAGLLAAAMLLAGRVTVAAATQSIDVDLLLVLFALLVAVELLRVSGYLDFVVASTVSRFHTTRAFALALIAFSGLLASLVTNDVTLFVVIPFTIVASRFSDFDVEDAVVLEVIATNLIGCLTPLGNPQNLFIFSPLRMAGHAFHDRHAALRGLERGRTPRCAISFRAHSSDGHHCGRAAAAQRQDRHRRCNLLRAGAAGNRANRQWLAGSDRGGNLRSRLLAPTGVRCRLLDHPRCSLSPSSSWKACDR